MAAAVLLVLFGVGLFVGFISGLVGIGGGVLMVPFLYLFYAHPEWSGIEIPVEMQAAVAHATSLFIIVPTAIRGTLQYHKVGLVQWPAALVIAGASMISAVGGAWLAVRMPDDLLRFGFGLLLLASSIQMIAFKAEADREPSRFILSGSVLTGILVGILSAMLGVGGGLVAIPMLIYVVGLKLDRVAATSLAIIVFAAISGVATYIVSGWGDPSMPPGSLGYVHVLAAVPMLIGAGISVAWGARANQKMPTRWLKRIFAGLLAIMGLDLIITNVPWFG